MVNIQRGFTRHKIDEEGDTVTTICQGVIPVTSLGTFRRTTTEGVSIVLEDTSYIPTAVSNVKSFTRFITLGANLGNEHEIMIITKNNNTLRYTEIIRSPKVGKQTDIMRNFPAYTPIVEMVD